MVKEVQFCKQCPFVIEEYEQKICLIIEDNLTWPKDEPGFDEQYWNETLPSLCPLKKEEITVKLL